MTLVSLLKKNHNLTFVTTLNKLFKDIDLVRVNNKNCQKLIKMINSAVNGISQGVYDPKLLLDYCKGKDEDLNEEINSRLDEPLDGKLFDKFMKMYALIKENKPIIDNIDNLVDLKIELTSGGIDDATNAIDELKTTMDNINESLDRSMSADSGKTMEFELDQIIGFNETIKEMNDTETFRLLTGTGIDRHTGGFAPTKSYFFIAEPGGGKSLTLLNISLMLKDYNEFDLEELDGMIPIVVYVSFENTRVQTFRRALAYYGYEKEEVDKMSPSEIESLARQYLSPKKKNDIRFAIKQFRRYSKTGRDLNNMVRDYEKRGYKVVALVTDYLQLHEYEVAEEDKYNAKMSIVKKAENVKQLAIDAHTPVITAGQTNREGARALKEAQRKGRNVVDPIKVMASNHIAQGFQVLGEVDFADYIYKGTYNGKDYLALKDAKQRDRVKKDKNDNSKKSGPTISVMPLDGFRITDETHNSAAELFPEQMTTVNALTKGNRDFKKMVDSSNGDVKEPKSNDKDDGPLQINV